MAILIVFLSDEQHMTIQHVHLSLVVHCIGCNLYDQDGTLPFINSSEEDQKKARQKWEVGKDPGGVCSCAMLVTNFGSIMAISTNPPYCLISCNLQRQHCHQEPEPLQHCGQPSRAAYPCLHMPCLVPACRLDKSPQVEI